jgi:hypothetical protein
MDLISALRKSSIAELDFEDGVKYFSTNIRMYKETYAEDGSLLTSEKVISTNWRDATLDKRWRPMGYVELE